ncbi:MAG: tetratricopeptide repeat protein [Ramlibacter sp.]|nr:tetratricopeptide repeat protein [Ramlibacter sp.]
MPSNLSPLESAWRGLRAALEQGAGLSLVFVFPPDSTGKQALWQRADDLMRAQVRPFRRPVARKAADFTGSMLRAVLGSDSHARLGLPLWLDLDGHAGEPAWDEARETFLMRLNERRAQLTRDHARPVVLVLPAQWTKRAAEAAPDLWTIRQPSVYWEGTPLPPPLSGDEPTRSGMAPRDGAVPSQTPRSAQALNRWLAAGPDALRKLSVWDGGQAAGAALNSGQPELALRIANQVVAAQRQVVAEDRTPERLRDLSISMNKLGDVAQALGALEDARTAYAESERIRRELLAEYGRTPERLRDLSISMGRLGEVAQALGALEDARTAYAESERIARELLAEYGRTPERLRDLSVSMERLGDVARALGALEDARSAYAEGERIARELLAEFGESVGALETLAYHLIRHAELSTELLLGDERPAPTIAAEALRLVKRLKQAMPHDARYDRWLEHLQSLAAKRAGAARTKSRH